MRVSRRASGYASATGLRRPADEISTAQPAAAAAAMASFSAPVLGVAGR